MFGLQGPSVSIDTACSASLVGAHYATRDLQAGDLDDALAAGVNLTLRAWGSAATVIAGEIPSPQHSPITCSLLHACAHGCVYVCVACHTMLVR